MAPLPQSESSDGEDRPGDCPVERAIRVVVVVARTDRHMASESAARPWLSGPEGSFHSSQSNQ
eukprot:9833667-Alexandrium_andersonii.AAC.1